MSIRSKLLLLLFVCIFGGLATVTGLVVWQTRVESHRSYVSSSQGQMQRANEYVELFFSLTANNARLIADLPEVSRAMGTLPMYATASEVMTVPRVSMEPEAALLDVRLEGIVKANPSYGDVGLGLKDGGFIEYPEASWPAGFDPRVRPWYEGAMASKERTAISKIYVTPQGHPVCAVAAKVQDASGAIVGASYIDIRLSTLVDMVDAIRLGSTGRVTLIENTGMIVASPQFAQSVFTNVADGKIPGLEKVLGLSDGVYDLTIDGVERTIATLTGFGGWRFVAVVDRSEIYAESNKVIQKILITAFLLTVVLLGLGFFFARSLTKPIAQLVSSAEQLAAGNFNNVAVIERQDEFGKLGKAFQVMAGQLKERLGFAQGIMSGMVAPFAVVDIHGKLTYVNTSMLKYWGLKGTPEDYYGKQSGEMFHNNSMEKTPLDQVLDKPTVLTDLPVSSHNAKGEKLFMKVSVAPLWDLDHKLLGSFMVIADVTEIREQQERIVALNERITVSVAEAHNISEQQSRAFNELSMQLEKTSDVAIGQEQESTRTMQSISGMSGTLEALADKARQTTEDTRATRREAESGNAIVSETVECITQVALFAERTERGMQALQQQAESITNIVDLIKDVADQTNLLALNAAIEAARAGDAGRGFAVVADEVRKLAEKTMHATNDVNKSVSALQTETTSNLEMTLKTVELAHAATALAGKSGETLNRIVDIAEHAVGEVMTISASTAEQSHIGADIAEAMKSVSDMARQSTQNMDESADSVNKLTQLSEKLKQIINSMGMERRRIERSKVGFGYTFTATGLTEAPCICRVLDISPQGLRFETKGGLPSVRDELLDILAETAPFKTVLTGARGRIVWQDGSVCGVEFAAPLAANAKELGLLCSDGGGHWKVMED